MNENLDTERAYAMERLRLDNKAYVILNDLTLQEYAGLRKLAVLLHETDPHSPDQSSWDELDVEARSFYLRIAILMRMKEGFQVESHFVL